MSTMKAAVWQDTNAVSIEDVTIPAPAPGWTRLKVAHVGICGTDLAIYHGKHPRAQHGLIMGHEIAGWVDDPSSDMNGALVAAEPLIRCGKCGPCTNGSPHVCVHLGLYGIDEAGALAEYVTLPTNILHRMQEGVSAEVAALVEPLAVTVHALSMSRLKAGDTVAVFGAGPIGLLTAIMARHAGASRVVIAEPSQWRCEVAQDFGFEVVPAGSTMAEIAGTVNNGEGFDIVFDSAGHPAVAAQVTEVTRVRGEIVIVGVHKQPAPIDLRDVCFKELNMVGVRVYTSADFTRAVALINDDALGLSRFPVQSFPLSRVQDAFAAAESGTGCLKVLVSPQEG